MLLQHYIPLDKKYEFLRWVLCESVCSFSMLYSKIECESRFSRWLHRLGRGPGEVTGRGEWQRLSWWWWPGGQGRVPDVDLCSQSWSVLSRHKSAPERVDGLWNQRLGGELWPRLLPGSQSVLLPHPGLQPDTNKIQWLFSFKERSEPELVKHWEMIVKCQNQNLSADVACVRPPRPLSRSASSSGIFTLLLRIISLVRRYNWQWLTQPVLLWRTEVQGVAISQNLLRLELSANLASI